MKKYVLFISAVILLANSCTIQPQKFDSEKWKSGGKSVRGSMIEDIKNNKIFQEKTKTQVQELLGKSDESQDNSLGYKVVTISRCYFWNCRLEINFDPQTKKTIGDIAVSD